jgi:hypothetical protein
MVERGMHGLGTVIILRLAKALKVEPVSLLLTGTQEPESELRAVLDEFGLVPGQQLRHALQNPEFLEFAEFCAKAVKARARNLSKMSKATRNALEQAGRVEVSQQ